MREAGLATLEQCLARDGLPDMRLEKSTPWDFRRQGKKMNEDLKVNGVGIYGYDDVSHDTMDRASGTAVCAFGLSYVPYNGFVARLHEGERVLTAQETRQAGRAGRVLITGNQFTVREEADIDKIGAAVARNIMHAQLMSRP